VRRNRELAAAKRIAETAGESVVILPFLSSFMLIDQTTSAKDEAAAKAFEKSGKKGPLKR
jgi:hypothetical protein